MAVRIEKILTKLKILRFNRYCPLIPTTFLLYHTKFQIVYQSYNRFFTNLNFQNTSETLAVFIRQFGLICHKQWNIQHIIIKLQRIHKLLHVHVLQLHTQVLFTNVRVSVLQFRKSRLSHICYSSYHTADTPIPFP